MRYLTDQNIQDTWNSVQETVSSAQSCNVYMVELIAWDFERNVVFIDLKHFSRNQKIYV